MAASNQPRERWKRALRRGVTPNTGDFAWMCKNSPKRIGIVAEGDSWFAYPQRLSGGDANVIDHIAAQLTRRNKTNLLELASISDTAKEMLSGEQKNILESVLAFQCGRIDYRTSTYALNTEMAKNNSIHKPGVGSSSCLSSPDARPAYRSRYYPSRPAPCERLAVAGRVLEENLTPISGRNNWILSRKFSSLTGERSVASTFTAASSSESLKRPTKASRGRRLASAT